MKNDDPSLTLFEVALSTQGKPLPPDGIGFFVSYRAASGSERPALIDASGPETQG